MIGMRVCEEQGKEGKGVLYASKAQGAARPACGLGLVCILGIGGGQWSREVFVREGACMLACRCGLRQKSVCTYTTGLVPTSKTKELGDVLEVSGLGVVEDATDARIAVAIKTRNGLGSGALRRIARCRRRAVGRALRLPLGLRALLGWAGHFELCIMSVLIGGERRCDADTVRGSMRSHAGKRDGERRRVDFTYLDLRSESMRRLARRKRLEPRDR